MRKLKPWAAGPFELLRHAEGHLKAGSDFDKRMALVSFDNAIEVSIATFLQLHPSQRGGKVYERRKVEEWLTNYHKKLEFFQHYAAEQNVPIEVSIDEIVFYHNLRNELYHSGNGMVPEMQCLAGAREAALSTFSLLFVVDAEALLKTAAQQVTPKPVTAVRAFSAHTEMLQSFIAFEKALRTCLASIGAVRGNPARIGVSKAWAILQEHVEKMPPTFEQTIRDAIALRNVLIHGEAPVVSPDQIWGLNRLLDRVSEFVGCFPASRDFLPELKMKVGTSIPDSLASVRIVQERRRTFLEVATVREIGVIDKRLRLTDLSFIGDPERIPDDDRIFVANKTADENADIFLREMADKDFCEYFPEMFQT